MQLHRISYNRKVCFVLLFALCLGIAPLSVADSITINGTTYDGVYVTQTTSLYFVRFPATGETRSYPAEQVEAGSFRESSDREELRARWREAANIDPQRLLADRDPEYEAPVAAPEQPRRLGEQLQYESNVSREDRERGVLERERVVGRDGTPSLVLRGNQKADRTVDAEIHRYLQEQQMLRIQQEQEWMAYQQQMQEAQQQAEQEAMEAAYQDYLRGLNLSEQELRMREQALRVDAQAMRNEWNRQFGYHGNVPFYSTPYGWPRVPVYIQPGDGTGSDGNNNGTQGSSPGSQYNNHGGNYTSNQRDRLNVPQGRNTNPWTQSRPRNTYPWSTTPTETPENEE